MMGRDGHDGHWLQCVTLVVGGLLGGVGCDSVCVVVVVDGVPVMVCDLVCRLPIRFELMLFHFEAVACMRRNV